MPSSLDGLITRDDIANIASSEDLIFDDENRISILEAMRSIDVQACPGSGKTTLIAAKLILLAKKWPYKHQGVCVLSHTNVAKDEIIGRLKKSKTIEARRLLSYPHFIGTIQEFIGKYIGFPFIRSTGIRVKLVDTDNCVNLIYANLQRGTRTYIDRRSQYSNVLYDFDLKLNGTEIAINVPTFPNGSTSSSYGDLKAVRKRLLREGCFFYRDIYAFAEKALIGNIGVKNALQKRFPCIFLDEMQDTQKYQDDILLQVFPLNDLALIIQRFGDPDQAIFHGIGGEQPNDSYNDKSTTDMSVIIDRSHRFGNSIAAKIRGVSFNQVLLEAEHSVGSMTAGLQLHADRCGFENTIIVYCDETIGGVIPEFSDIVSRQFTDEHKSSDGFSVKVVGAVGKEIDPQRVELKIGHYWNCYDKAKAKNNFRESSLIEAVRYCRQSSSNDWASSYKLLTDCILKLLRIADKQDLEGKYFSAKSLRVFLKTQGEWRKYRELIHMMMSDTCPVDQEFWIDTNQVLSAIFNYNVLCAEVAEYMAFSGDERTDEPECDSNEIESDALVPLPSNWIQHSDGFRIGLSTIHGVKGETHDATLVLETKSYCFDLGAMIPYLTGELPSEEHPNSDLRPSPSSRAAFKPNQRFMRQFYVAMSRPKYLLCLAIHSDRISDQQRGLLQDLGWHVRELLPPATGNAG